MIIYHMLARLARSWQARRRGEIPEGELEAGVQVDQARLYDERIEQAFARDLALFYWIAELVERTQPRLRRLKPVETVRAFAEVVRTEMDLRMEAAAAHGWTWDVELPFNPDPLLIATAEIVATADSVVLDQCAHWFNLARAVVERCIPTAHVVDLASES